MDKKRLVRGSFWLFAVWPPPAHCQDPRGRQSLFIYSWFLPLSRYWGQIVFKVTLIMSWSNSRLFFFHFFVAIWLTPVPRIDLPKRTRKATNNNSWLCRYTLCKYPIFAPGKSWCHGAQLAKKAISAFIRAPLVFPAVKWPPPSRRRYRWLI